jgi:hypothetical protein
MWFIGTANNDDSTFAISDKVYDRAIPINIDTKGVKFDAPDTDHLHISYSHIEQMFEEAKEKYKVSEETLKKLELLDDYVIQHFRLAFGNRIVKQLRDFVRELFIKKLSPPKIIGGDLRIVRRNQQIK